MPAHDDTTRHPASPPTPSIDRIRRELERHGAGTIRQGDMLDSITRAMGSYVDHLHTIPPAMVGVEESMRETTERIRDLATGMPQLDILLPRAPEPGELSLLGGYSGVGRSMFGGIPIHQSDAVPEGSAYLVDRNALQFDPRASLQLDGLGSSLGITRLSDEAETDYEARLQHALRADPPLTVDDYLTDPGPQWGDTRHRVGRLAAPEPRMNPEPETRSLWQRMFGILRRQHGRNEQGTPLEEPWRDCYMCGIRGYDEGLFHPTNGLCNECHAPRNRQPRGHCVRCGRSEHELDSGLSGSGHCPSCTYQRWQERDTRDDAMFESAGIRFSEAPTTNQREVGQFIDNFLNEIDSIDSKNISGPTVEELEATYRV